MIPSSPRRHQAAPQGRRLGEVAAPDSVAALQVGDGAGDGEQLLVAARGEIGSLHVTQGESSLGRPQGTEMLALHQIPRASRVMVRPNRSQSGSKVAVVR